MRCQPKSPDDLDVIPFICTRCGAAFGPDTIGFIDREGLPVHEKCGEPGEVQEYKDANGGDGYKLSRKYFPGWPSAR